MIHRRLGLLGHNISYSRSPIIHRLSAELCNIHGVQYEILDLAPHDLHKLPNLLKQRSISGFNITTPYKSSKVMAALLGSQGTLPANTATYTYDNSSDHHRWQLTNTDGIGFIESLLAALPTGTPPIKHLLFLGFGGATQGVCQTIARLIHHPDNYPTPYGQLFEAPSLTILWRRIQSSATPVKHYHQVIKDFQNKISPLGGQVNWQPFDTTYFAADIADHEQTLVVQATPLPHQGDSLSKWTDVLDADHRHHLIGCMDMTYHPPSHFLAFCRSHRLPYASGWDMLIEQARAAQKIWWSVAPDPLVLKQSLQKNGTHHELPSP